MREIILITDPNYGICNFLEILKNKNLNVILHNDISTFILEIKINEGTFEDIVQIEEAPELKEIYDSCEISEIKKIIPNPTYYFIHFKDIEDVKEIIKHIANRADVLIDNDFGLILSGKEFIKLCNSKPGWDWAKENSQFK